MEGSRDRPFRKLCTIAVLSTSTTTCARRRRPENILQNKVSSACKANERLFGGGRFRESHFGLKPAPAWNFKSAKRRLHPQATAAASDAAYVASAKWLTVFHSPSCECSVKTCRSSRSSRNPLPRGTLINDCHLPRRGRCAFFTASKMKCVHNDAGCTATFIPYISPQSFSRIGKETT